MTSYFAGALHTESALHRSDTSGGLAYVPEASLQGRNGKLAGAFYGEDAIPPGWRKRLAKGEVIEQMARRLHAAFR